MAVVVFDADVLIGFLGSDDPHHTEAVGRLERSMQTGTRRFISAVNYTEVLIGPLKAGGPAQAERVDAMLVGFGIETVEIDMPLAQRAASVRARTNLKLPDAYAVATAIHAEKRGWDEVRLESFDDQVVKAYANLHPFSA